MVMRQTVLCTADAVEDAFYEAMQQGELEAMMTLWADEEEVMCIHPGHDRLIGLQAIRASWEAIFRSDPVNIQRREVRAHTSAVLAVHNLVEHTLAFQPTGGASIRVDMVECVATNIYVKQADGWRIMLHHSALRPSTHGDEGILH